MTLPPTASEHTTKLHYAISAPGHAECILRVYRPQGQAVVIVLHADTVEQSNVLACSLERASYEAWHYAGQPASFEVLWHRPALEWPSHALMFPTLVERWHQLQLQRRQGHYVLRWHTVLDRHTGAKVEARGFVVWHMDDISAAQVLALIGHGAGVEVTG